jgi:hypothetical protein
MAKKKKAARRGMPVSTRSARCQPLRDQLRQLDEEIADPDIPRDLKKRLKQLRERVLRALRACESVR